MNEDCKNETKRTSVKQAHFGWTTTKHSKTTKQQPPSFECTVERVGQNWISNTTYQDLKSSHAAILDTHVAALWAAKIQEAQ